METELNEIGSCVLEFIESVNDNRTENDIIFWSDDCTGDNDNDNENFIDFKFILLHSWSAKE